jgi:uncharacterized membrane protein YdjX (TVP38/TMEM64 family)
VKTHPLLRPRLRLLGVVLLLVLLFALSRLSGLSEHFSLAYLHQRFVEHKLTGMLVFIVAFALGNLVQIPGWIFLGAAVLALGRAWGGLATYVAACISCAVTFYVVRLVGGEALRGIGNPLAARLLARLDAHPVMSVALLRLLFQTVPALNYALAVSGLRFRPYFAGTLLGLPLPILLYCYFFDQLALLLHIHY